MIDLARQGWRWMIVQGALTLLVGLAISIWPDSTRVLLLILLGLSAIGGGLACLVLMFKRTDNILAMFGLALLALASLALGVVTFIWPEVATVGLLVFIILQAVFATMWRNTTGEDLFQSEYFPEVATHTGGVPIQVVDAGPDSQWEAIRQSYLAMIALARHHVYIQSPFLILDTSVAEAMKTAALSGLDVRVMIAPSGAELSPAYRAGLTFAADMARAGVRVLMYHGAYFHSKTVCMDSILCSIGSANMDIRSFSINYETNLVIYDETISRRLEADFMADLAHCVDFSATEYETRGRRARFVDSTLRLAAPLL